jgi:choline dehydrogenase-like flavoprotein
MTTRNSRNSRNKNQCHKNLPICYGPVKVDTCSTYDEKIRSKEISITFPGDECPKVPHFIICGAGTSSLPLAYGLTNQGYRVLMIEAGYDQSNNPIITQPFASSPYEGTGGIVQLNILNAALDPQYSSFLTSPDGPGDGFRTIPVWTGRGVGGGGLHWFLDYVRPTKTILDGPLPVGIIPPNNTSTFAFAEAGGPEWSNDKIQSIITNKIENFRQNNGNRGITDDPTYRGYNGPETVLQIFPQPPEAIIMQNAFAAAATSVTGGALSPVVADYNVPNHINSTSQIQELLSVPHPPRNILFRQNSATSWAGLDVVVPDEEGNLVGVNGRRLVILTNRVVVRTIKDKKCSKQGDYVSSGVEFLYNNELYFVRGNNIIAGMGAGYSPLFWMRSGIGPRNVLTNAKIPVEVDSKFIGQNLQNQYGSHMVLSSSNKAFGTQFLGQTFIQYNNVPRRWQIIHAALGPQPLGIITPITFPKPTKPNTFYFYLIGFLMEPRSRGYISVTQSDISQQPNVHWGFHSDGPIPNDPASGLSDPDSDISNNCALYDYEYQVVRKLQADGNPNDIEIVFPPSNLFTIPSQTERYQAYVPYITMYMGVAAHESGTVVMNDDPNKGACDKYLRLHGTKNCFEVDGGIAPVLNSGNTGALEQAIGINAAELIPKVALL